MDRIICIVGPTATGKTRLSISLCKRLNGEVVSCDSMQLYRGMDIGTAKPSREEQDGIPHHMIDCIAPQEDYSVGRYVADADPIVQDILARGKTCVLVGGTGLYLDSLIQGRDFAPLPQTGRRQALEQRADREGTAALLRELATYDPETAARLHPADRKRILRACEVYEETGIPISEHNRRTRARPPRYTPIWLGLTYSDRAALYAQIDRRVDLMMQQGLAQEVSRLLALGVPAGATAMQAIGYKELVRAQAGECTAAEAVEAIKRESRRYAKRQMTWFRRNPAIHWFDRTTIPDFSQLLTAVCAEIPFFDGAPR